MNSIPVLVILLDDQNPGFWDIAGWPEDWADSDERTFKIYRIPGYRSNSDAGQTIRKHLQDAQVLNWRTTFKELYIVTDSQIADDPAGGSRLLEELRMTDDLRWKSAVVYSDVPLLDGLAETNREDVHALEKVGVADCQKVRTYFDTGIFPSLDAIWQLIGELRTLNLCCQIASRQFEDGGSVEFSKVRRYGCSAGPAPNPAHVFDPVLIGWRGRPLRLYGLESMSSFSARTASQIAEPLLDAEQLHLIAAPNSRDSPLAPWEHLCRILHPIESLEARGSTRVLWEWIQTGGDPTLIDEHPVLGAPELSARERCWVRSRLEAIERTTNDAERLSALVTEALREHDWLLKVPEAIQAARNWKGAR